jgi:uncharacterized protein (DUF1810 family)
MSAAAADPFELKRFLAAQEGVYATALGELERGSKQTHWMWFIFPQIEGLGSSPMSRLYAIKSIEEATAYRTHPLLGARLTKCAQALLAHDDKSASDIMGFPDDMKLRSCMTLFARVSDAGSVFHQVLDKYFAADPDQRTLRKISNARATSGR